MSASNATTTRLNLDFWLVILLALKFASAWANHTSGMSGQNVGNLTDNVPTVASSSTLAIVCSYCHQANFLLILKRWLKYGQQSPIRRILQTSKLTFWSLYLSNSPLRKLKRSFKAQKNFSLLRRRGNSIVLIRAKSLFTALRKRSLKRTFKANKNFPLLRRCGNSIEPKVFTAYLLFVEVNDDVP